MSGGRQEAMVDTRCWLADKRPWFQTQPRMVIDCGQMTVLVGDKWRLHLAKWQGYVANTGGAPYGAPSFLREYWGKRPLRWRGLTGPILTVASKAPTAPVMNGSNTMSYSTRTKTKHARYQVGCCLSQGERRRNEQLARQVVVEYVVLVDEALF